MTVANRRDLAARNAHSQGRDYSEAPGSVARHRPYRRWEFRASIGDVLAAAIAFGLIGLIRITDLIDEGSTRAFVTTGLAVGVMWPGFLALNNAYELRSALVGVEELRRVLRAGLSLLAGFAVVHFFFELDIARSAIAMFLPAVVVATAVLRRLVRSRNRGLMASGLGQHRALVVGPVAEISELCHRLSAPGASVEVVAYVADDLEREERVPEPLRDVPRLPSRDALQELAVNSPDIDLLIRAGRPNPDEMATLTLRAHEAGMSVAIAPHRRDTGANMAMAYTPLGGTSLLMVEAPALKMASSVLKTVFDRVVAAVVLVLLAPGVIVIACVIAVRDGRPVIFRQERVGRGGKSFVCLKFRTMARDAESMLDELAARNEAGGPLFKIRDDPRITPMGRWLRRRSLDELPQLFNVLKGEMSIVGPRPPLPSEVATYDERTARRLLVRPGITGLWQVEGRSNLPWDDGVYFDLMYVDHWSPLLDLVIMARTLHTVLRPNGAY